MTRGKKSKTNFNSNSPYLFASTLQRFCLAVFHLVSLLGTFYLFHPMHIHIFMEERDFYPKIRKKYWNAYFGPLSHPLFTLPKGGGIGLIDELTEEQSPGITSPIPVGRGT